MKLQSIKLLIAMICAWVGSAALAATPPGMPQGWSDGYAYLNGARIHYYHAVPQPGKPVIVMVHGVSDIGLSWTTLTQDLQKSYDIYMLDTRGHGLSDPFPDSASGDVAVEDVVAFVRTMKFDRPILMGHSMGAATVMRIGATYRDLARAIVMLDPGLGSPTSAPATAQSATAATTRRPGQVAMFGAPEMLVAQNNDAFDDLLATCTRQNKLWDTIDCQYWALSKQQYHGPYTAAQMQMMRVRASIPETLAKIAAPSLILKADATREVREANLKAASTLKNGKLVHIDGAAHNLHHDKRARTVELLTEFFGRL